MARKSAGRRKVKMAKIQHKGNLDVTFSKRREGMFKKANELSILCGAEPGIIVFAPNSDNKVYSYGHPNVNNIVDRYLARYGPLNDGESSGGGVNPALNEAIRKSNASLINELNEKEAELAREIKRGEALLAVRRDNGKRNWWEAPIDKLNCVQLQEVKEAMKGAYEKANTEALLLKMLNVNVAFPYSRFGSALAPGHNYDSSGASGSGTTSYTASNKASGSGSAP